MSKPKQPGYLVPENPSPEGLICLKVWIPEDDLYLHAFAGAYQYFSKWTAWERSSDNKAALAAAAWKNAYYYTLENGWLNCGEDVDDCCEQIEDIIARLEELENMNINVNCGCGCGNNQQQVPTECYPEGAVEDDVDLPVDPGDDEQIPLSQQAQCNAANYIATTLRNTLVYLAQQGAGYGAFKTYWMNQWNVLPTPPTPPSFGAWVLCIAYTRFVDIPAIWDSLHNNLVCMLYQANSLYGALTAVRTFSTSFPNFTNAAIRLLAPFVDYNILFDSLTQLPPGYDNRSCCGNTPGDDVDLPLPEEGYFWLPIAPAHLDFTGRSFPEGGTPVEVVGDGYMRAGFAPGTIGNSNWDILYDEVIGDVRLPSPGDDTVGLAMFLMNVEHTEDGGSPQAQWVSPTGGGVNWYVDSAPANPTPVLSGFIYDNADTFANSIATAFDYADDGLMTALQVAHQIGGAGPKNMTTYCRLYWLVKL